MSKLNSSSFQDSPNKKTVREDWNTPFLRYIHDRYNIKYRYMGFPGTDLIDVRLWKDMIEEVIAFELLSPEDDDRIWIKQLRLNLKKLGIPSVAYLGSFEEVVILGKDYEGQPYRQDKVITLYNLDFCDEISSSIETLEHERKVLRYEAIRAILREQKRCFQQIGGPSYFVILLTIRNQIEASKIRRSLSSSSNLLAETSSYCLSCERTKPIPMSGPLMGTHAWSLKAFLYDTLIGYLKNPNISAVFFPIVKYYGGHSRGSPMFHWMMFCKFGPEESANPNFYPARYLETVNSLCADRSGINIRCEPGEIQNNSQDLSPVGWFQQFESLFSSNGRLV